MWLPGFLQQLLNVLLLRELQPGLRSSIHQDYPRLKHPNQQIRLLHLFPEDNKPLRCNFSVAFLEDKPKYNALS